MTTGRRTLVLASALDVIAAAALFLPWWQASVTPVRLVPLPAAAGEAETWSGWEVLGRTPASLLAVLAVTAVAIAFIPAAARALGRTLAAAGGASAASCGLVVLFGWGVSPAPGPWVALLCGIAAVAVTVRGPRPVAMTAAVALLVATGTAVAATAGTGAPAPVVDGPFVRVTGLDAAQFRSGTADLRVSLPDGPRLVPVDGSSAVGTRDGIARVGADGKAEVLARFPDPDRGRHTLLGVAGDRIAWQYELGTISITGLRAGDPIDVMVSGVAVSDPARRVGDDGVLWLRAAEDRSVRSLDIAGLSGTRSIDAADLPVVPGAGELRLTELHPIPGGAIRMVRQPSREYRLERATPAPGGITTVPLAGGRDPGCGFTGSARATYLPFALAARPDPAGGIWFVRHADDGERWSLARVEPDGTLRAVPHPMSGDVYDLLPTADGGVDLLLGGAGRGLWRLPDAAGSLADLPPAPPDCTADPTPAGPPVELLPVADVRHDSLGIVLGADGRWASGLRDGMTASIEVVMPDGSRNPLGQRVDGNLGDVWPDGTGGVWWVEVPRDSGLVTLVHARTDAEMRRYAPVEHPSPGMGSGLLPDFGGRPPLLGTAEGAYRIDRGSPELVVPGSIKGGVVRADGRGWVLADDSLVAVDGDRVLGPVIDAAERRHDPDTPVAVQLASGVPPDQVTLPSASVALDERGRAIVVSDGVVLAVDDAGQVAVVAHDTRLDRVRSVEGGLAVTDDGTVSLVVHPR